MKRYSKGKGWPNKDRFFPKNGSWRQKLEILASSFAAHIFKNSAWGMAGNLIMASTGIIQISVITRALGVELYGIFVVITVFPQMVQQFASFRTWEFVARYFTSALERNARNEAGDLALIGWATDGAISVFTAAIVFFAAKPYLIITLGNAEVLPLVMLFTLVPLSSAVLATSKALLRVFGRFDLLFIQDAIISLMRLAFVIYAVTFLGGLTGVVIAFTVVGIINSISLLAISLWQARTRVQFKVGTSTWEYARNHAREFVSFLGAGYVEASILSISRNLDVVLLSNIGGPAQVGLYRAAHSIIAHLSNFLTPMINAVLPDLQRSMFLSKKLLKRRIRSLTLSSGFLFTIGSTITFVVAPWFVLAIMGPDFSPAASSVRIMIWAVALQGSLFWLPGLMLTLDLQWIRALAIAIATAFQILLIWLLTPVYGQVGAAFAYVALFIVYPSVMLFSLYILHPENKSLEQNPQLMEHQS